MWNLINAPETEIFGIAIALMVLLGVLEVISMLAGGISDWLDNLLPDSLTETAHAEVGLDVADAGIFVRFLSWLYVGRIPVLMLMVVFLAVYGLTGYLFQTAFATVFGSYLNGTLAAVIVWFISLPLVRVTASGLYKIMPKDETTAVLQESLIGRVGTVVDHFELGPIALALIKRAVPVDTALTAGPCAASIDPDSYAPDTAIQAGRAAVDRLRGR